jgi:hypothetical protein
VLFTSHEGSWILLGGVLVVNVLVGGVLGLALGERFILVLANKPSTIVYLI